MRSKEEIINNAYRRLIIRESFTVVISDALNEYASQSREPSTQGEKDAYNAGLMCERILAKDSERLKQENERLKDLLQIVLSNAYTLHSDIRNSIQQALNPKRLKD